MPVADARFRLPRVGHDAVGHAAFVIGDHGFGLRVGDLFDVEDRLHLSAARLDILVVAQALIFMPAQPSGSPPVLSK